MVNRANRMVLLDQLEKQRKSRIVVYITGDRRGHETKISADVFPMFHKHLMRMGHQKRIDLFLYTTGGITMGGFGLVNLIREFCDEFGVIVPFKAYSCGTLIALGANRILMTKMGQLSPIDPSVHHPLGPQVKMPGMPMGGISPVNVEDVNAFVDLAKKELNLKGNQAYARVLEILATAVNPLVLGAVQRSRAQIGFLASTLMKRHTKDSAKIRRAVEILTRERFSHDYLISAREAKEVLDLNVETAGAELTSVILRLFEAYSEALMLDVAYHPEVELGGVDSKVCEFQRAVVESTGLTHTYKTRKEIKRVEVAQPGLPMPATGYQERTLQDGWEEDNN